MRKKNRIVGSLEREILEVLWQIGEGGVRDVVAAIGAKRSVAYTTVMTVMNRMTAKGYLRRRKVSNGAFHYTPRYHRDEFYAKASSIVIGELIRDFGSIAVAQFVDALEELRPQQLEIFRRELRRKLQSKKHE